MNVGLNGKDWAAVTAVPLELLLVEDVLWVVEEVALDAPLWTPALPVELDALAVVPEAVAMPVVVLAVGDEDAVALDPVESVAGVPEEPHPATAWAKRSANANGCGSLAMTFSSGDL
jgi:hypothetical protein